MTLPTSNFLSVHHEAGDKVRIATQYWAPQPHQATFMWFSGFKSDMASQKATALAAWAQNRGAGCLLFDYSGHGRSEGRFIAGTISRWLDEATVVFAQVTQKTDKTVFVGSSMGGWIALLLALKLKKAGLEAPHALVLIAPAWDMTRMMWEQASPAAQGELLATGVYQRPSAYSDEPYVITRTLIEDGKRHLFGKGPAPIRCPVRILQGLRDEDVPYGHALDLMDVLSAPDIRLTLIKDGEHRLSRPQDLEVLFTLLEEFRLPSRAAD